MDDVWVIEVRGYRFTFDEQDGELRVNQYNTGGSQSFYNTITRVEDVPGFARGWVRAAAARRNQE